LSEKDPAQRFQSMQELNTALRRLSDSGALYSPATVRTIVPSPPPAPPRVAKALIFFVLLGGAVSGGYWLTSRNWPAPPSSGRAATAPPDGTLTNDSIIEMVGAKVPNSVIVSQIRASKTNFNLSAAEVIRLSKAGVTADVIEVMRNPEAEAPPAIPVILGDGLPIRLTLAEDIPRSAVQGDPVRFKVAHDLLVDRTVVVSEGTAASGSIVDAAKRKILGFGGKMTYRLEGLNAVDGRKINIRAASSRSRDEFSKRPVDTGVRKPKELAAPAGAEYLGYIDGPQTVLVRK
jgi:hypothetical protein